MKNWSKIALSGATLGAAVLVLAGCSSSKSSSRAINAYVPAAIQTLDSGTVTDSYSMDLIGNTEEGLTRNNNGQPSLALAKSIETSKDGKTVTVTLRDGLKWSNGDKLTAQDFVYAWERAADPATASQYAYMIQEANIANADAVVNGKADKSTLGVKAESDTKLVITLTTPTPYLENVLALPVFYPVDPSVVQKDGKAYGTNSSNMVYDGPFMFKSTNGWNGSNNTYTIYKNPDYYDAKNVKASEVNWQTITNPNTGISLYKSGKVDYTAVGTSTLYPVYKDNKATKNLPVSENEYIEFNQSGKGTSSDLASKALQNVNIRKAISLATDRAGAVNTVSPANKPATGFTPAGTGTINGEDFSTYAKQPYTYNATEAKKYWEQGLKELGVKSLTLNFETDSDSPTGKQNADFLKQSFEKTLPGFTFNEVIVPFKQRLKDAQNGNFDLILSLWGGDYSEPSTFLTLFLPGGGQNDGRVDNAAYNEAIKKATSEPDISNTSARYADYKAAEKALYDDASVDPVEFYQAPNLVNPNLQGVVWNATGLSIDLKGAYIK